MRLVITSDLHCGQGLNLDCDIRNAVRLADHAQGADLFILAGDVGETTHPSGLDTIERTLAAFLERVSCRKAALAGNHDIAVGSAIGKDSERLFYETFPGILEKFRFSNLEEENILIGKGSSKSAVVGTLGPITQHLQVPGPNQYSRSYHMFATGTLKEFEDRVLAGFAGRLAQAQADASIKQIVVVTHIPVTLKGQVPTRFWPPIESCRKVSLVVFGDTHKAFPEFRLGSVPIVPTKSDPGRYASVVVDLKPGRKPLVGRWWLDEEGAIPIRV